MAKGNAYLVVPKTGKDTPIPATLKPALAWQERKSDKDEELEEKHPTWLEAGERHKQEFGEIREHTHEGRGYLIIEFEFSFLRGDIQELLKLQGENKDYLILNNSEAQAWLAGEDIFQKP